MNKSVLEKKFRTMKEMLEFMRDSGRRHNSYHHYTNFDSIKKILSNKTLLLSRVDTMNDKQELSKIRLPDVSWMSTYSTSFTYGIKENMALWGLYSIPGELGIRFSIEKKELLRIVDNNEELGKLGGDGDILNVEEEYSIDLYEVLYASNHNENKEYSYKYLIREGAYFSKIDIGNLENEYGDARDLVGTFKNEAWSYEQEVRLRVKLTNQSAFEKVILDISDLDLSKLEITFSPWVGLTNKERIKESIKSLGEEYQNIVFMDSDFTKLASYRDKCDYCIHDSFVNKELR